MLLSCSSEGPSTSHWMQGSVPRLHSCEGTSFVPSVRLPHARRLCRHDAQAPMGRVP